jgi:hypothetical protein
MAKPQSPTQNEASARPSCGYATIGTCERPRNTTLIALCARARRDQSVPFSVRRHAWRHSLSTYALQVPSIPCSRQKFPDDPARGGRCFERRFRKRSCRWDACAKAPEVAATASVTENSRSDRIFIELASPQSSTFTSEACYVVSQRMTPRCLLARCTDHSATLACFVSGSASSASVASTRDLMSGPVLTPADVVNAVNAQNLTLPSGTAKIGDGWRDRLREGHWPSP